MAFLKPMLHCHRNAAGPASTQETERDTERAMAIAGERLEAFGLSRERSAVNVFTIEPGKHRLETIEFPERRKTAYTLWEPFPEGRDILRLAASVETAIAWKNAGLIDEFCDRSRWSRRVPPVHEEKDPETWARVRQGMAALGLPWYAHGEYEPHKPERNRVHRPCPWGRETAAELSRRLDHPALTVILFGSRGRGGHTRQSDVDIMVTAGRSVKNEERDNLEKRAAAIAA